MKITSSLGMLAFLLSVTALCQMQRRANIPSPTPYSIIKRDADSRIWGRTTYELLPSGQIIPHKHRYTELGTGLCFQRNGRWVDSQEQIVVLRDGSAAATNGQHQAFFPADIYKGIIKLVTPDGLQLQSRPIGLGYDDGTNTVFIAELTNSVGLLISANQVIYPNAFVGIDADLLYTYRKSGLEEDIIFRDQPPTPEQLGLASANISLQLLMEFINPSKPVENAAQVNPEDGLGDKILSLGTMKMIQDSAFAIGQEDILHQIPIYKNWVNADKRTFLIEELPYRRISLLLATLPRSPNQTAALLSSPCEKSFYKQICPISKVIKSSSTPLQITKCGFKQRAGVVFDCTIADADQGNFTFRGDTTYLVSGDLNLYGTTTIQGGAVIKYEPGKTVTAYGSVDCQTANLAPAIFTARDDDSVGERITGSTGNPTGTYPECALSCQSSSGPIILHDLKINHASVALQFACGSNVVRDVQFGSDRSPLIAINSKVNLQNAQIYNAESTSFEGENSSISAENLILHDNDHLWFDGFSSSLTVTKSRFVCKDSGVHDFTGSCSLSDVDDLVIFQTVGDADHYLSTNNLCCVVGTANIAPIPPFKNSKNGLFTSTSIAYENSF